MTINKSVEGSSLRMRSEPQIPVHDAVQNAQLRKPAHTQAKKREPAKIPQETANALGSRGGAQAHLAGSGAPE